MPPTNIFRILYGNVKMPALGYGSWQASDAELEKAVEAALEAGYRHIDTAHAYENEKTIGNVVSRWIKSGKLERKDLFLVTKVPPGGNYPEGVSKYLKRSLENLQVDYIDLYLVHVPFRFKDIEGDLHPLTPDGSINFEPNVDHNAIWKAMENQLDAGLTRAIGLSNFNIKQISNVLKNARTPPALLQIEVHAYFQQNELVEFCKKNRIAITAYSPLGSPGLGTFFNRFGQETKIPSMLANPVVTKIAKKHNKTEAQVLLRYTIQRGISAIPKSVTPSRIKQNIDIFDFSLDEDDVKELGGLDKGPGARILDFGVFKGVKEQAEFPF